MKLWHALWLAAPGDTVLGDRAPEIGSKWWVWVGPAAPGAAWVIWRPPFSQANDDWGVAPQELLGSVVARCRLEPDVEAVPRGGWGQFAENERRTCYRAFVEEVQPFVEFCRRAEPSPLCPVFGWQQTLDWVWRDGRVYGASLDDALIYLQGTGAETGMSLLLERQQGGLTALYYDFYSPVDDEVAVVRRRLSPEEQERFERLIAGAAPLGSTQKS